MKNCKSESKTKRKKSGKKHCNETHLGEERGKKSGRQRHTKISSGASMEYKGRENTSACLVNSHPEWDTQRHYLGGERSEAGLVGRTHCSEALSPESMHVEQGFEPALQSQTDANHITIKLIAS